MPDVACEFHTWRIERVVFRELELGGEDTAFEGSPFGALDQGFPGEDIVFRYRARGDAVGWGGGEGAVFLEEAAGGE